jgi:hypothetical protein
VAELNLGYEGIGERIGIKYNGVPMVVKGEPQYIADEFAPHSLM